MWKLDENYLLLPLVLSFITVYYNSQLSWNLEPNNLRSVSRSNLLFLFPFPEAISEGTTGQNFTMVFPENIAYFYPVQPKNNIIITALYDNTEVVIMEHKNVVTKLTLSSGETRTFDVSAHLELSRSEISNSSLQISSNKLVTVHEVFLKNHSIQTSLVTCTDKLGTHYLIPPVPIIVGTTHLDDQVTTENNPFRIIIINTEQHNTVSLTGIGSKNIFLLPHQVASIWLKPEEAFKAVSSKMPIAVLFGHACANLRNCACAQLYTTLLPTKGDTQKFYIPPSLTKDAENETYVLMSTNESRQVKLANQVSPALEASESVILHRPGLLLPLIPETDHGACFLAITIPNAINVAVIVVQRNLTAGVYLGHQSLESLDWQELAGNDYVSAQVNLQSEKSVIWHTSSKMAVYSVRFEGSKVFGNPAAVISKSPGKT